MKAAIAAIPDLTRWEPRTGLGLAVRQALPYLPDDLAAELFERIRRSVVAESTLRLRVMRGLGLARAGLIDPREVAIEDYGIVSRKVVTDVGVGFIVDAFQNSVEIENMKFHGLGTGSTAEAAGDTALVTELTTEYTGNVRATGTTEEGATANIYKTVATNTLDGTPGGALREHGVFSASSAGVLLDRSVFAAITLASGDALQSDYRLTLSSGG